MSKKANITEQTFKAVKIMLNGGASYKECAEYLSISITTVGRIKAAQTYEEFKHSQRAENWYVKSQKEKQEKKTDVKQEAAEKQPQDRSAMIYQYNRLIEEMRQMNEHLKLISNKIAFIVEQLA